MTLNPEAEQILGMYFPVLDHGFVALVDAMGNDLAVEQAARVSYGAGTRSHNETRGLLRYMLRENHTSPFEQVELKFHVKLPIFVARQLIRHRTANVNEYSLRYSLPAMQFYMPDPSVMGKQSKRNKQGRAELLDVQQAQEIRGRWIDLRRQAKELYELCVAEEVDLARELARLDLPLSLYTEWYWKIDLHNCLHFLKQRCDSHAQWEIQEVSRVKAAMCKRVAPISFEAWIDYHFQAHRFSRIEMKLLRRLLIGHEGSVLSMGGIISKEAALEAGLSEREWGVFGKVFDADYSQLFEPEGFELDLSKAKTAEYFKEEARKYLPEVKKTT